MDSNRVITLARALMTEHGVGYCQFGFHSTAMLHKKVVGKAWFTQTGNVWVASRLTLGIHWTDLLPENKVREVILHEIAHLRLPHGTGHNPRWQAECRRLGIQPNVKFRHDLGKVMDNVGRVA